MQSSVMCQRLCECLGVSRYEAKVYVSLVETGAAEARTLSTMSGVPRSKVYDVLRKLMDMGFVVEIPEQPKKFAPTPPRAAFESYLHSYQDMVENLLSVISSLEDICEEAKSSETLDRGTVWIIKGRREILKKIQKMLIGAKHSVCLATNENGMVILYKSFNRLFDELAERSVKIKIVTTGEPVNRHILDELRYTCMVEETDFQLPLIFLSTDAEQVLLASLRPDTFSLDSDQDKCVFFDNPALRQMICLLLTGRSGGSISQLMAEEAE